MLKVNLFVTGCVVVSGFQLVLAFPGNAIIEHQLKMEAKETDESIR